MKTGESGAESEGACTGGNFLARRPGVKPYGAILGMQMHRNNERILSFRGDAQHQTRNLEIPGSLRARND
jgi:hypothetical protein